MTKAYRCDRCQRCFDGVPKEEVQVLAADKLIQFCEDCHKEFESFLEQKPKEAGR